MLVALYLFKTKYLLVAVQAVQPSVLQCFRLRVLLFYDGWLYHGLTCTHTFGCVLYTRSGVRRKEVYTRVDSGGGGGGGTEKLSLTLLRQVIERMLFGFEVRR